MTDPALPDTDVSKPERILQAAEQLLAEGGHASLTVGEIARRAEVSRGLVHYYFASMEDILVRIVRRNAHLSLVEAAELVEDARERDELIATTVAALGQRLVDNPEQYAAHFEAYVQGRVHDAVREQLTLLYQQRRDALAGGLRQAEVDGLVELPHPPDAVASVVMALAEGVALQYLSDPSMPADDVLAVITTMFDRLLRPGGP